MKDLLMMVRPTLMGKPNRTVRWLGRVWTIPDLARHLGMNKTTLYYRIFRYGWSVHDAVNTPVNSDKARTGTPRNFYHYQGKDWSLKDLSEAFDISYRTLHWRIVQKHWSVASAIETPVDKNKSRSTCHDHE